MKKKTISFVLILLAASLVFPMGSYSFAVSLPVASNDSYIVNENNILDITAPGILANDTATVGKTLTAGLVSNVKNGTLILNSNGSFIYVPDVNFHGIDRFKYIANDGTLSSNIANVTIIVKTINRAPVARNDIYSVNENTTLNIKGHGVLANDTDANGITLTAVLVTNVLNGVLALNQNGSFTYTPNPNFYGIDSFTYKANDGLATSNIATVTITVNKVSYTSPPPTNNPILQLIAKIQDVLSKITGIEKEITALEEKNKALESRIVQLESLVQNNKLNVLPSIENNGQQNDSQHNDGQRNNGENNNGEHNDD
jgi:hypothetical protein